MAVTSDISTLICNLLLILVNVQMGVSGVHDQLKSACKDVQEQCKKDLPGSCDRFASMCAVSSFHLFANLKYGIVIKNIFLTY